MTPDSPTLAPTPRTDAILPLGAGRTDLPHICIELAGHARVLERELTQARAEIARLQAAPPVSAGGSREAFCQWLVDRAAWLDKEIRGGGNFEHLSARLREVQYILEKWQAALAWREGGK